MLPGAHSGPRGSGPSRERPAERPGSTGRPEAKVGPRGPSETLVQTILFAGTRVDPTGQEQAFFNPMQVVHGRTFPLQFDLVILSAVHGAPRGQLGCTHRLLVEGTEVYRFDHPPAAVPYDRTGLSFRLELQALQIAKPCTLVVKTELSSGVRGQDLPLRVVASDSLRAKGLQSPG